MGLLEALNKAETKLTTTSPAAPTTQPLTQLSFAVTRRMTNTSPRLWRIQNTMRRTVETAATKRREKNWFGLLVPQSSRTQHRG